MCGISTRQCCNSHHSPQDRGHQEHVPAASVHPLRACWVFHLRWCSCTSPAPSGRAETWLLLCCSALLLLRAPTIQGCPAPPATLTANNKALWASPLSWESWKAEGHGDTYECKQSSSMSWHSSGGVGCPGQQRPRNSKEGSVAWGQSKQQLWDTDKENISNSSFFIEI